MEINWSFLIKEILTENNSVIIPYIGELFIEKISANIDVTLSHFDPPKSIINFEGMHNEHDKVLINKAVATYNISYVQALSTLQMWVKNWKSMLYLNNYMINDIGRFYLDVNNTICFEELSQENIDTNNFGLGTLFYKPLQSNNSFKEKIQYIENKIDIVSDIPKDDAYYDKKNNGFIYASFIFICLGFFTINLLMHLKGIHWIDISRSFKTFINKPRINTPWNQALYYKKILQFHKNNNKIIDNKYGHLQSEKQYDSLVINPIYISDISKELNARLEHMRHQVQGQDSINKVKKQKPLVSKSTAGLNAIPSGTYFLISQAGSLAAAQEKLKTLIQNSTITYNILPGQNNTYFIAIRNINNQIPIEEQMMYLEEKYKTTIQIIEIK